MLEIKNSEGALLQVVDADNLIGVNLWQADLAKANLWQADLTGANLWKANLVEADLWNALLIEANLVEADLTRANLWMADLTKANLIEANLTGVDLRWAAGICSTKTDKATIVTKDTKLPYGVEWDGEKFTTRLLNPERF